MSTDPRHHAAWPEGHDCLTYDELDSTMAEAARLAPDLIRPTWIMARRQTDGRGRSGRVWAQPDGNLAATLVYRPRATPQEAALRSFIAANALFETLALYTGREVLAVKWPNDVLLKSGKVAGILLEASGQGGAVDWLSVGVGVNLASAPDGLDDAPFAPVSVAATARETVPPEEFLAYLAGAYATQEKKLGHLGFDRIRRDWLKTAARLGETITARTTREDVTGQFDTIDSNGNLVLITAKGPRAIPAADVYF